MTESNDSEDRYLEEIYRDDHMLITEHSRENPLDSRVAVFVGQDPDEETPHIVDAEVLAGKLSNYVYDTTGNEQE